jgi:hypothetical protein
MRFAAVFVNSGNKKASPVGRPRKAGFLMQPEGTRANRFSACFSRRPRQGDNLPERVKADGNEDTCHPQCITKATEPYGIAEVARSAGGV